MTKQQIDALLYYRIDVRNAWKPHKKPKKKRVKPFTWKDVDPNWKPTRTLYDLEHDV